MFEAVLVVVGVEVGRGVLVGGLRPGGGSVVNAEGPRGVFEVEEGILEEELDEYTGISRSAPLLVASHPTDDLYHAMCTEQKACT